jgi:A/G-specific adenine glycosylase
VLTEARTALLSWYDSNGRELPWRRRKGRADPYRVWLSEVMLQQTVAAAVKPYFARFLELWPDVNALAAAPREDVLREWAGLGYYARARNLHEAAKALAAGGFPKDEAGWRALPGVGVYTAAAIAAIALNQPANAVDGNVERVMARFFAVEPPLPEAKPLLRERAARFVTAERPGAWAQALMDLGATICTPKSPSCAACPWRAWCRAYAAGAPETFPRKRAKAAKPRRHGVVFWLERDGKVLLTQRPDKGLLGGMMALPSTPWRDDPWTEDEARAHAPAKRAWVRVGAVEHVFTHFALTLDVWRAAGSARAKGAHWIDIAQVHSAGLPTVFRKAAARAAGG